MDFDTKWEKRFQSRDKVNCSLECGKPDCYSNEFKVAQIKLIIEEDMSYTGWNLFEPFVPKLITIHKPQISLIDFVTYILSCISFWFGWAPLPFLLEIKFDKIKFWKAGS